MPKPTNWAAFSRSEKHQACMKTSKSELCSLPPALAVTNSRGDIIPRIRAGVNQCSTGRPPKSLWRSNYRCPVRWAIASHGASWAALSNHLPRTGPNSTVIVPVMTLVCVASCHSLLVCHRLSLISPYPTKLIAIFTPT
jgi:hypothetical protein